MHEILRPLPRKQRGQNDGKQGVSSLNHSVLCRVKDIGLIDYEEAFQLQKQTVAEVIQGEFDTLLLCEHPMVFTLGRLADEQNFLIPPKDIQARGIKILPVDRGGEVTLHGPGQIVTYPIFHLNHFRRDLRHFLYKLEQVAIDLLQDFDIVARRISGRRGVWVGQEKIASLGIGVKKWVSFHGMAVNVNTDLDLFSMIKPCGLDVKMTSMAKLLGHEVILNEVKERIVQHYCSNFNLKM